MANDRKDDDLWAQLLGAAQTEAAKEQEVSEPREAPEDPWAQMLGAAEKHIAEQGNSPAASDAPFAKGSILLDTYRIESDPLKGGMGSVWRVHHTGWNVDLAMKRPLPERFADEASKKLFIDECQHWIKLGLHPNIVSCYYVREIDGVPTIFSEWMENGDLKHHIDNGTLYDGSEEEVQKRLLDIAIQYARGLHYAHEQGLIHQDVKPANLLLTSDWQAKAADFGLANARAQLTVLEGDITQQDPGQSLNAAAGGYTPAYCSMEQLDGKTLTRRTDIYSWAVSVMEMYYGSRPWANGVVAGAGCRDYMSDPECRIKIPEGLQDLLGQCMEANADDRPHDFAAVLEQLKSIYREIAGEDYPRPEPEAAADTADSLNNTALSYLDMGMPEKAEQLWDQALQKDARHLNTLFNRTLSRWRRGLIDMRDPGEQLKAIQDAKAKEECVRILEQESEGTLVLPEEELILPEDALSLRQYTRGVRRVFGSIQRGPRYVPDGEPNPVEYLVYGVPEKRILFSMEDGSTGIYHGEISMSWDGEYVAVEICREDEDGRKDKWTTEVYQLSTGNRVGDFPKRRGKLSPDGAFIVFMDRKSGQVFVYETATGRLHRTWTGYQFWGWLWDGRMVLHHEETMDIVVQGRPDGTGPQKEIILFNGEYFSPPSIYQLNESQMVIPLPWMDLSDSDKGYMLCDVNQGTTHLFTSGKELEHMFFTLTGDGHYVVKIKRDGLVEVWNMQNPRKENSFYLQSISESRFLYMAAHPGCVSYTPGTRADYRLNVISGTRDRLNAQKEFSQKLQDAQRARDAGDTAGALRLLDEAMTLPGFEASPEALRMRAGAGAGLKKLSVRRIVPLELPALETAPSLRKQAGQEEVQRFASVLLALEKDLKERWEDDNGEWQIDAWPREYSRDGRFLLIRLYIRQDYDNPAQDDIEITQWGGGAVVNVQTGEVIYQKDYFYCYENMSSIRHTERDYCIHPDHTGSRLLVCGDSNDIQLIPLREGISLKKIRIVSDSYLNCDFLTDDRFILFQGRSKTVRIFDTRQDTTAEYVFDPAEYGEISPVNDDCFAIRRRDKQCLCWIEWNYELPEQNA